MDHGTFSHAQLDQVKDLNPRVKLSIALSLQKGSGIEINFRDLLHRQQREDHDTGRRLYSHLAKIGKTFVTTNYDEWLDDELPDVPARVTAHPSGTAPVFRPREVYFHPDDLVAANLNRKNVVLHLHGSVKNPGGMILTTPHYVQHYANDRRTKEPDPENNVLTFLEYLFASKTVLFVGYGLEELEILEYVILKARLTRDLHTRHFLLQGYFSHEYELMRNMQAHYRECGIELLPFSKDSRGWEQLLVVLESFGREIPASSPKKLQQFKDMEALLDG